MTKEEKIRLRNLRGYYFLAHGHYPEDERAKIKCLVCQKEFQKKWDGIKGKDGGV